MKIKGQIVDIPNKRIQTKSITQTQPTTKTPSVGPRTKDPEPKGPSDPERKCSSEKASTEIQKQRAFIVNAIHKSLFIWQAHNQQLATKSILPVWVCS